MSFQVARPTPVAHAAEPPRRLVLVGHPVEHSRSPIFQNAALASIGSALRYEALDVPPPLLDRALDALVRERAAGNVTVPHKATVWARCNRRTLLAEQVGAENCFWTEGSNLVGDNTDVAGAQESIQQLVGAPSRVKFGVRLLGAGGSAAAVLAALAPWPEAEVSIWARTPDRAFEMIPRLRPRATLVERPDDRLESVRLIINATPVGLDGTLPPVPIAALAAGTAVFDLTYAPNETRWVREARARGLRALDGLRMLVEQGAWSFARWFGRVPDRRILWAALGTQPPTPTRRLNW
ncbi:MAG: shikimate dehydrogenase [Gemmatimonadaceae bacterium]|nr:shikimate dehydrogenase [Gemmatimonadaceae bacterium]